MSIILKGIDMPKDGKPIRLVITSSGDVVEVWRGGLEKAYHRDSAIQIPKDHGAIKDTDEIITLFRRVTSINKSIMIDAIQQTDTILEAEE